MYLLTVRLLGYPRCNLFAWATSTAWMFYRGIPLKTQPEPYPISQLYMQGTHFTVDFLPLEMPRRPKFLGIPRCSPEYSIMCPDTRQSV